ncbi:MAG TPA: hypothetical protein VIN60_11010, partial [Anaerolineales bacterium]
MKKHKGYLFVGLVGIMAFALIIWITPYGAGVSPDSTIYIGAAKSLLAGKGFSINGEPIIFYPPLYALLLAAIGLLENNLVQAARILNAALFGINVCLIALAVYLITERDWMASGCATGLFLSSAPLLELHSYAWSEPLFITLTLASIILLSRYVTQPKLHYLVLSSLSLGLALTTRYIG